jgi:hypothetical protein
MMFRFQGLTMTSTAWWSRSPSTKATFMAVQHAGRCQPSCARGWDAGPTLAGDYLWNGYSLTQWNPRLTSRNVASSTRWVTTRT